METVGSLRVKLHIIFSPMHRQKFFSTLSLRKKLEKKRGRRGEGKDS